MEGEEAQKKFEGHANKNFIQSNNYRPGVGFRGYVDAIRGNRPREGQETSVQRFSNVSMRSFNERGFNKVQEKGYNYPYMAMERDLQYIFDEQPSGSRYRMSYVDSAAVASATFSKNIPYLANNSEKNQNANSNGFSRFNMTNNVIFGERFAGKVHNPGTEPSFVNKSQRRQMDASVYFANLNFQNTAFPNGYPNGSYNQYPRNYGMTDYFDDELPIYDDDLEQIIYQTNQSLLHYNISDWRPPQSINKRKHTLRSTWTFWLLKLEFGLSWMDQQTEVISFDTMEDFNTLCDHIKYPSELPFGYDYSVFRKDILPAWEDPINVEGGQWVLSLPVTRHANIDILWQRLLHFIMEEDFLFSWYVVGVVVSKRYYANKITVWTKHGMDQKANLTIGYKLQKILGPNIGYQMHQDIIVYGPNRKWTYIL